MNGASFAAFKFDSNLLVQLQHKFDLPSGIMRQRLSVSENAVLNTRCTQFIKCDGLCKRHKNTDSPICQTLFPPLTSMRCTKTISRPGMVSYRKSLLTLHSVMEMCFSCFMNTEYKYLRCELPICNKCSVFEENGDIEGWTADKRKKDPTSTVFRYFASKSYQ